MVHSARSQYIFLHPSLHCDIGYTEIIVYKSYVSISHLIIGASVTLFVPKRLRGHKNLL